MRNFIFITSEGYTFQSESYLLSESDVENCQVLGFESGINEQDAFDKLLKNNNWLQQSSFDEAIVYELKNKESLKVLSISNSNGA